MRRVVAGAAALALAVASGCGGDGGGASAKWDGDPLAGPHPELPDDRIVTGKIRNDGDETLRLDVRYASVLTADGRTVQATVRYAQSAGHSLYPPRDAPRNNPSAMRERLGDAATIETGATAPLTVAWRGGASAPKPAEVDLGPVTLPLPDAER
jgi:hypothetical protein